MKRPDALVTISRRQFCGGVAGCLGVAALASCGDSGGNSTPDAHTAIDAPAMGTCSATGITDVGVPSTFMAGKPVYFSTGRFFVVRDSGGLYALTARCTHQGVTTYVSGGHFYCPGHGATFDFNGNVLGGPTVTPLYHYAMCTLSNGHVGVNLSQTVSQSQRLNA
jgi:nitrite reductase/ring-hydroxylating ferredoxin subunit